MNSTEMNEFGGMNHPLCKLSQTHIAHNPL